MENVTQKNEKSISGAIKIDEKEIGDHLNQLVRQSAEDTEQPLTDKRIIQMGYDDIFIRYNELHSSY